MAKLPQVVFVLGGPGAGKGTQCQLIVKDFGFVHLSAGDLLREEQARPNSEFGALIDGHIRNGTIVPVEITCGLLEREMKANQAKGKNNFLVDGFPRNQNNLEGWNKQMEGKAEVKMVLFFDCNEEVCVERCLSRGQAGSNRSDDNIESLKKRIATYNTSTRPVIDHYDKLGLVKTIDASVDVDQVFEVVKKVIHTIL